MTPRPWLLWLATVGAVVSAATAPMYAAVWREALEGAPAPHMPIFVVATVLAAGVAIAVWAWPGQWLAAAALGATHLAVAGFAWASDELFVPLVAQHFLVGVFALAWAAESIRLHLTGNSSPDWRLRREI